MDLIVVYKVDRLTRSLGDFAKLVERLDAGGASFVSVTQSFNTTTSMGRLTLNVLLSFAQFEREVTGERIRDKIAASKKKGMWMGGCVPIGYDCVDRRLVINEKEAPQVRRIFALYRDLGNVEKLKVALEDEEIVSKSRLRRNGKVVGGNAFSNGARVLTTSQSSLTASAAATPEQGTGLAKRGRRDEGPNVARQRARASKESGRNRRNPCISRIKKPIQRLSLESAGCMAERTGLEPATSGVTGQHSNQLNYRSAPLTCSPCGVALQLQMASPRGFEPLLLP